MLDHKVFIGSFHKTGTALMGSIWRRAAKRLEFGLWIRHEQEEPPATPWLVCFHHHARFGTEPERGPHRGLLMIRDPRDIIVSGMHYHCKSEEAWLHTPQSRFGGRSYQQALLDRDGAEARLLFELENAGGGTIRQMLATLERYPHFHRAKLEALATDHDLMEFHRLFSALGFPGRAIPPLLAVAWQNSIFSGQVKPSLHVRTGHPAQWATQFAPGVLAAFADRFGDAAERLGYPASTAASRAA